MKARCVRRIEQEARWMRLVVLAALPALVGCQLGPKMVGPVRAIWVTRSDYKTADDVQRIIKNCDKAGFNTVLFQVRGNGTVFYPSDIEPWAEQFDFKDPGYDPLQLAIDEAHDRDMQLHAWVNVMPAWRGPNLPADPNQLYFAHPEWFWYDPQGIRQPLVHNVGDRTRGWYASVNPCLPEVREYLVDVFQEIVANYDVDGLHMDYIRFPNERVVPGEVMPDYPYDERTLALYKADTGLSPGDDAEAWNDWRSDCVTQLVSDIHAMVRETRDSAVLSAAVGSVPERALTHFQDSQRWIEDGVIDTIFLMNYTSDPSKFRERIEPWTPYLDQTRIVPGLWFDQKIDAAKSAEVVRTEIETAREMTGNFCVFAYSSLFDSTDEDLVDPSNESAKKRAIRREEVMPWLASLDQ